ncbi:MULTISPECIES: hypothetical protein [unclassified Pseudomonas]|uniref:hypothetical protein n=1 Tax=unclassified Pseudomonas TaxID=196821 RepID=UPI0012951BCC|nr:MULTISPECIES: hypothetical protein [unclassified Pseudomonas]MQT55137.1 hypothetical protein [Pseudomonas sp. FSL R10-2398]MQU03232.1 hypothetical protein [Pseudomonas sp. FSL R10-2245]MQU13821.1 hypothetical protein [Pseudomonas sp. FSL R10-2189]MQU40468.1 hypothetical protein [Pseudomonas sp. FSL R10-2172]
MAALARITLLSLAIGLSACSVHQPYESTPPTPPSPIPQPQPSDKPLPDMPIPQPPKPLPRTSATFAPPPGGPSHWDARLGVYVLDDQSNIFYRQRTYYRWDNGWSRGISPNGPWEETDTSGVPPGLSRQFK